MTRDDFNLVRLAGHLGQDPVLKYTNTGLTIATASIAVGGGDKKDGGKWPTHWIDIKAFGDTAESLASMSKGAMVKLKGELAQESWEKDGAKRSKIVVIIRELEVVSRKEKDAPVEVAGTEIPEGLEPF